jgi:hypothetical protein
MGEVRGSQPAFPPQLESLGGILAKNSSLLVVPNAVSIDEGRTSWIHILF